MSTNPNLDYRSGSSPTSAYEHGKIHLLPGEQVVFAADFTPSPLLRHIKTGLLITQSRLAVREPQYIFFVFKVGHTETTVPIRHICDVTMGRLLSHRRVRSALIVGLLGMFILMSSASFGPLGILGGLVGLALLAFAAFQSWMARSLGLMVTLTGGSTVCVNVDKTEYPAMLAAGTFVQEHILDVTAAADAPSPASERNSPTPPQNVGATPRVHPENSVTPPTIWRG